MDSFSGYAMLLGDTEKGITLKDIEPLLGQASVLLVAGRIARAFMMCLGYEQDDEEIEEDALSQAYGIIAYVRKRGVSLELPLDYVLVDDPADVGSIASADYDEVPSGATIVDLGLGTLMRYEGVLTGCPGVILTGCVTRFDNPIFRLGTNYLQRFLLSSFVGKIIVIGDDAKDAYGDLVASGKASVFRDVEAAISAKGGA